MPVSDTISREDSAFHPIWTFPLTRTHTGVPLGNGRFGALVWGGGKVLRITLGRADWWDHRAGRRWQPSMTYAAIRSLVEAGDAKGLNALFAPVSSELGTPQSPSVLPVGRMEMVFPGIRALTRAILDMAQGELVVYGDVDAGLDVELARFDISPSEPVLRVRFADDVERPEIVNRPAWEFLSEPLGEVGFCEPKLNGDGTGWVQNTPQGASLALAHRFTAKSEWRVGVLLVDGKCIDAGRLDALIDRALSTSFDGRAGWWNDFWGRVPKIHVPTERWRFLLYFGLYKFSGYVSPAGPAGTLQGPWIEEYQMPPWSSDYHFNINVQMCHSPAYQAGLTDSLLPLFGMVERWLPILRENAHRFVGIEDGYMLPHAVDDRCQIIGSFWTGTVDHGCSAWVAKMMFDYWSYTGDDAFLRRLAFPFMRGVMRVYMAMLERDPHGGLCLPFSVSPEYRADRMDAWGVNASFQLAACHWLARALQRTATILGEASDREWAEVIAGLPLCSLHAADQALGGDAEIAVWDGQLLDESHRHHSHLAGIYPFDVLDPQDAAMKGMVQRSQLRWVGEGMGKWAGWSLPWAVQLHTRFGQPDMAVLLVDLWERVYTNEGRGTVHDPVFPGFSELVANGQNSAPLLQERMQVDAGMGIAASIMDAMVHTRQGLVYLFAGVPLNWANCGFENIRVEGGFALSAERVDGRVGHVRITASREGRIRLRDPWDETGGRTIDIGLQCGETRVVTE